MAVVADMAGRERDPAFDQAHHRAQMRRLKRRQAITAYLFLVPYLVLLAMFGIFPVLYAFGLSFFDTIDWVFWGLTNYEEVLGDFRLMDSIVNVLSFLTIWLALIVVGVTVLALMLDTLPERRAAFFRTAYFLPGAVTSSAIVVLWLFLLDPVVSPYQSLFALLGWESRDQVVAMLSFATIFALMAFLANSGGWIVVIGGALKTLPRETLEAAVIDGASQWDLAVRIKLRMIWRSIALMGILSVAGGLQIFVEPQLMGMAGPQYSRSDWSLNQLAFQYAFSFGDFGAAAALSVLLLTVSVTLALIIIFATRFYRID